MKENYSRRMIVVKCSYGTQENYLNVKTDHGIICRKIGQGADSELCPFMNANDHIAGENIIHFGRCISPYNKIFALESKRIGQIGDVVDGIGIALGLNEGYMCEPQTDIAWKKVSDKTFIEGVPAITDASELTCYYGGIIRVSEVQSNSDSE